MLWYVGRRLLQTIPVILGATLLIYALVFLRPGDPVLGLFGDKPVSDSVKAAIEAQYHLDKPFIVQWLYFLKGVVTLDLGTSFDGQLVLDQIKDTFPVTITLAIMALICEMVFGVIIGTIAGLRRNGWFDSTMLVVSLVLIAIPIFVIGFVFQLVIGVNLGWAPPTVGGDWTVAKLILPAIVLGIGDFAYVLRLTRTSVADSLGADFVRTARAKGLPQGQIVTKHVLRNSLIPVVTHLGVNLGGLMAGAIITEGIFNVPGVGNLAFRSINKGDNPTVVAIVTLIVLVYVLMSLLVDLLYAVLDPRIRYV